MKRKSIDLNCDLGESFGVYTLGLDEAVMPHITSANIACGWHAGDPVVMNATVRLAVRFGIRCGAHPGYPDLLGFGRRAMQVSAEELACYLVYQIGALDAFCRANGVGLAHVKPHGGLYHAALASEEAAQAVVQAIASVNRDLILVSLAGQKGDMIARIGREHGLQIAREAFPDRQYTPDGALAPRHSPGAVITDPDQAAERAVLIATGGCIETMGGGSLPLQADTLCVHGDNPHAVAMVKKIRMALDKAHIDVRPLRRNSALGRR